MEIRWCCGDMLKLDERDIGLNKDWYFLEFGIGFFLFDSFIFICVFGDRVYGCFLRRFDILIEEYCY